VTDFSTLIRLLVENGVKFIIVGGAAATAHGSARLTLDLDIVYERSPANIGYWFSLKRAAGRPKDLETIAELERIQQVNCGTSES